MDPVTNPDQNPADAPQGDADAPLNEGGMKALAAERLARKQAETALAQLREEVRTSEAATLRSQIAAKHRLPPQLARRLQGGTAEELEADALELAGALTPSSTLKARPTEKLQPGAAPDAAQGFKPSEVVDKILG